MSQRFVESAFRNINHRDQASLYIEEQHSKDLLIQKLHVGTGSVDRFGIVEQIRTSVFTLCDHRERKSGHHCLGFARRKELAELLEGSTRQRLYGTKVTNQSRSDLFVTD